ncbi:hypothetical protein FRC02_007937 [Tulasnella sp. 418]|nr:hypothetical protein FRC02_007937 [Tulasnella sp. 418]
MKLISISFALTLISIPSPASASVIPRDDEGDINLWPILHPIEDILHRGGHAPRDEKRDISQIKPRDDDDDDTDVRPIFGVLEDILNRRPGNGP